MSYVGADQYDDEYHRFYFKTSATGFIQGMVDENPFQTDDGRYNTISNSLALDENNYAHMIYHHPVDDLLMYATNMTGVYTTKAVDEAGGACALVYDGAGTLHAIYSGKYALWHAAFPAGATK
jgi:hypothetical protein